MRFFRTVAGKALLFLTVIFCVLAVILSGFMMYVNWEENIYRVPKEQTVRDDFRGRIPADASRDINEWVAAGQPSGILRAESYTNLHGVLRDSRGRAVMYSDAAAETIGQEEAPYLTFDVSLEKDASTDGAVHVLIGEKTGSSDAAGEYQYDAYLDTEFPYGDEYAFVNTAYSVLYALRYWIYAIAIGGLILGVIAFVSLMYVTARRPGTEELRPGVLTKIPTDVYLVLAGGLFALCVAGFGASAFSEWAGIAGMIVFGLAGMSVMLGICMNIAARIKQQRLFRHTVIFYAVRGIFRLIRRLPLIWKTVLFTAAYLLIELIVLAACHCLSARLFGLLFLRDLIMIPLVFCIAVAMRRLQREGQRLANGEITQPVDTKGYAGDFRKHAMDLSRISQGMNLAVEERMKSERMKTELITNVSHDLKTPLTSIVNYAALIADPDTPQEQTKEYAEVLVRQSDRLKRLIEDLVEASKASTGNLDVELTPCDANVFLEQASGEYGERFEQNGLELVMTPAPQPVMIRADGRRMWRIFDNLMSNACKYAQPGTRVYLSMSTWGTECVMILRNTSKEALNITADELMERFVRADASRSTEGNGLGLSIAKSLAELQGGKLELMIDGDLFKAILRFPVIAQ